MGASPVILEVSQYAPSPRIYNNVVTRKGKVSQKAQRYVQVFLAEYVATTLLLLMVCLGCMDGTSDTPLSPIQSPLVSGFAVASLVTVFGHVTGAHMNPAVTACFWTLGLTDLPTSLVYFVAEMLGAVTGVGLLRALIPATILLKNPGHCETNVHPEMAVVSAAFFEFLITSVLILLVCGITDARNATKQDSTSIKFGLVVAALSYCGAALTGASLNPARSFGPAIWRGAWAGHWAYWVGPMAAGFLMPAMYKLIFQKDLTTNPDLQS